MRSVFVTVSFVESRASDIFATERVGGGGEKGDADPHIFRSLGGTSPQLDSATIHGINQPRRNGDVTL